MLYLKIPLEYLNVDDEGKNEENLIQEVIDTLRIPSHVINERTLPDKIEIVFEK